MALVWSCADDDLTCGACAALGGSPDGDRWWSDLEPGDDVLYRRRGQGAWKEIHAEEEFHGNSGPPLHDHCRCGTANDAGAEKIEIRRTPPFAMLPFDSVRDFVERIT